MLQDTWTQRRHLTPGIGLFLFFAGILAGVLFVQMQKDDSFAGIFSEYFLNQYASLPIDYKKLFRYVGGYRCSQYGLMLGLGAFFAAPFFFRRGTVFAWDDLGNHDQHLHSTAWA